MKNYDRTLWENNKTVVDAEKLNNIEDQVNILSLVSVDSNQRLEVVENTLPMKSNTDHEHDDLISSEELDSELTSTVTILRAEIELLKTEVYKEFKQYFDDAEVVDDMLNLYSNGKLLKSVKLPKGQTSISEAICGMFLCGELNCGNTKRSLKSSTIWVDGVTPVNATNLNNIENKIIVLGDKIQQIIEEGVDISEVLIHVGSEAPIVTSGLWIDSSDEEPNDIIDNTILDSISLVLQEHKKKLEDLYFLTDAYLDDGEFEDEEDVQNLDGGTF